MTLQPNILFHDRYLLQEMKGRGSFGEVWLAKDNKLDIDVAVKVYIALDTRGVEEFRKEYKTAFGLNHPNLLHAHHFDICEDRPYLVMPYCPGSALDLIGHVDEPTMWRFVRDVASGLEYLHSMDVVHHDIKPDNVMMDADGKFLITDFGISINFRSTLRRNSLRDAPTEAVTKGGSIPYMAPEMFGEQVVAVNATDIWALGVTMYEMMAGELPFFGQGGVMQLNGAMVPEVPGNWSDNLKTIVKMCLASKSWDRPTAKQLREYAQAAINGEKDIFKTGGGIAPKTKKDPKWIVIGAAVVVLAIAGLFVARAIKRSNKEKVRIEQERIEAERQETQRLNADYAEMARQIRDLVAQGTPSDTNPWFAAKDQIENMRKYEKDNEQRLDSIVSDRIQSALDAKLKEAAENWVKAAESQARLGEVEQALKFYETALKLYESPEIRNAYEQLK